MEKINKVVKQAADILHDNEIYFALVAIDMDGNIITHCCGNEELEHIAMKAIAETIYKNHEAERMN